MPRGVSAFDNAFAWVEIVASSLGDKAGGVLANLRAFAASATDADAEDVVGADLYGVAGFLFRPRDATTAGSAEALAARATDDLVPFATRDLRISAARGTFPKGTFTVASYTGAHMTILDAATGTGGSIVMHQPTRANDTGPAHEVVLDSAVGAERITITHALGHKVVLDETGKITIRSRSGTALLEIDDAGGVLASNGGAGVPVALAAPVGNSLGALITAVNKLSAAVPLALAGTVPDLGTIASSVLKASP